MRSKQNLILVNESDEQVGCGEKMDIHRKNLLHRAFSIFIFDWKTGKMLLQRRASGKYHSGGLWTNACCSHPHINEKMDVCLSNRLQAELGLNLNLHIVDPNERKHLSNDTDAIYTCGKFIYQASFGEISEHEIDHVFLYCPVTSRLNSLEFAFNPEEIAELQWVSIEEIKSWLNQRPEDFTVWFKPAFDLAYEGLGLLAEQRKIDVKCVCK